MHQIYLSTSICKPQLVNKCAMNMRVPLQLGNFGIKITVSAFVQSSIWYNKEKILTLSAVQLPMSYTSAPMLKKENMLMILLI